MNWQLAILVLLLSVTPSQAQWLDLRTPLIPRTADGEPDLSAPAPRTADGRPDLSGLWSVRNVTGSLLDETRVHEWARTTMAEHEAGFFLDDPQFQCLPSGPGTLSQTNVVRRIIQSPTVIAILYSNLTYRQIFTDGRELEPDPLPTWTGYSVGRWDGDTLVVESNGYNDRTWLHARGLPHTERLRVTERYRRVDFGRVEVEVSYEDSDTFDTPLEASFELRFRADDEMLESVCDESSEGRSHWSGDISQAEAQVVEVAPETLARYVGAYEGIWLGNLIRAEVTLEDGELYLLRTPPYRLNANIESEKLPLVALSDTAFECICGLGFIFSGDEGGMATEVAEVHVSGAWPFVRVE